MRLGVIFNKRPGILELLDGNVGMQGVCGGTAKPSWLLTKNNVRGLPSCKGW